MTHSYFKLLSLPEQLACQHLAQRLKGLLLQQQEMNQSVDMSNECGHRR